MSLQKIHFHGVFYYGFKGTYDYFRIVNGLKIKYGEIINENLFLKIMII